MEVIYFTLVAIMLYFVSDWLLRRVEAWAGRSFEHRTLIFFFILLILAMSSFTLIQHLTA